MSYSNVPEYLIISIYLLSLNTTIPLPYCLNVCIGLSEHFECISSEAGVFSNEISLQFISKKSLMLFCMALIFEMQFLSRLTSSSAHMH